MTFSAQKHAHFCALLRVSDSQKQQNRNFSSPLTRFYQGNFANCLDQINVLSWSNKIACRAISGLYQGNFSLHQGKIDI